MIYPVINSTYFSVTVHGADPVMSCRYYHIGGISPRNSVTSSAKNFEGRLQQLVINGERVLDEAHLKQIEYEGFLCLDPITQHLNN